MAVVGFARAAAAAPAELTVVELGWPATTIAATFRHRAYVRDTAVSGKRIGTVDGGARVTWRRIIASHDACKAWLEIEPRGWACARELIPTDKPAPQNAAASGGGGEHYADVRPAEGTDAYDDLAQITAATPARHVPDKTYVAMRAHARSAVVGGLRYYYTDQGWIVGKDLSWYAPSTFAGIELPTGVPAAVSLAWALGRVPGGKIIVRDSPAATGTALRQLTARDPVTVAETSAGFARIGTGEWVDLRDLRSVAVATRPDGIAADERWLDVDLDQQVLVAYHGDTPEFATLVSTGRRKWATPSGIYRITAKEARTRMQDPGNMADEWNVADVPWTMHFRRAFALHGTYWHDGFGRARSHGCVNLSTHDAKRIYDFVSPLTADGWSAAEAHAGEGTPVRLHRRGEPDPIWRDFDGKPLTPR